MKSKALVPPKLASRLLSRFLRDELEEEVLGDLEEKFFTVAKDQSVAKAKLNYWYQTFHYCRPFAIKKSKSPLFKTAMYSNYFKIGYRNLLRNKGYSLINIGGLAVGMAVAILIGLWIYDEVSFDHYHENHARVAQVMQHQTYNGHVFTASAVPAPLEDEIKNGYSSDFKYIAMASWNGDCILAHGDKNYVFSGNYMGSDIPKMLSLKMLYGSRNGLAEKNTILLSQSVANTFFGDEDPVGKTMQIDNNLNVLVTGVYEDLPHNSSLKDLKFIAPWKLYLSAEPWAEHARSTQQWDNNSFQMYVMLEDFADMESASRKIADAKYDKVPEAQKIFHAQLSLHPMEDWHLRDQYKNGIQQGGLIQYVWMFGIVGVFVLVLACINFMNLSTARSEKRAKEVGIRKSIGSVRWQLINQFLSESFLVVLFAYGFAVVLVIVSIPFFNQVADKQISFPYSSIDFWTSCVAFILITGFIAGSYPAFYLSSFRPAKVLKGVYKAGKGASVFRRTLVVIQFSISIILIIGTLIVNQQIQFSMDRPLGYNASNLLMMHVNSPDFDAKYDVLRDELKKSGAVEEIAASTSPLTAIWSNSGGFDWEGKDPNDNSDFAVVRVTHDYGKTVDWEVTQGRDFSRDFADTMAFIINETAAIRMGFEDPIGKTVRWGRADDAPSFKIVGVVKDMLMDSPFRPVKQCIYMVKYTGNNWMEFKLNPERSTHESIVKIGEVMSLVLPNVPFDYQFVDQEYTQKFVAEERIRSIAGIFAVLAVLISCLGLFGLSAFVAEQRAKEIGIRKVMGATVLNICALVSREFILLVLLASFIAIPVAYYFLNAWLQNYEYHISIGWWVFAFALAGAVFITISTVSFQAIKSAVANPVKSLRSE